MLISSPRVCRHQLRISILTSESTPRSHGALSTSSSSSDSVNIMKIRICVPIWLARNSALFCSSSNMDASVASADRKEFNPLLPSLKVLGLGRELVSSVFAYRLIRASCFHSVWFFGSLRRTLSLRPIASWAGFEKLWNHLSVVEMISWAVDGGGGDRRIAKCNALSKSCSFSVCIPTERSCARTDGFWEI